MITVMIVPRVRQRSVALITRNVNDAKNGLAALSAMLARSANTINRTRERQGPIRGRIEPATTPGRPPRGPQQIPDENGGHQAWRDMFGRLERDGKVRLRATATRVPASSHSTRTRGGDSDRCG
jgi:hypothetical protein